MGVRVWPVADADRIECIFMTFAWYGHLKFKEVALWKVILVSWAIALFEYCLQVPANRMGSQVYTLDQLKVIQEVITLTVFRGIQRVFFRRPAALEPRGGVWLPGGWRVLYVPQVLKGPMRRFSHRPLGV
jgi:uncharacterized protein (DUF486 family)